MPRPAAKSQKRGAVSGKRYPLNMRTTFEVRQKLERAAAATGRSLAQEVEYRLDLSFSAEAQASYFLDQATKLLYGPAITMHLAALGHIMNEEADGDPNWSESEQKLANVRKRIDKYFDEREPRGEILRDEPIGLPSKVRS